MEIIQVINTSSFVFLSTAVVHAPAFPISLHVPAFSPRVKMRASVRLTHLCFILSFNHSVCPPLQGGELWSYIYEKTDLIPRSPLGGFVEPVAQFYAACVISAFGYIHSLGCA